MTSLGIWIQAIRPKTLPAAIAPVLIGTAMAYAADAFYGPSAACAALFALLIQIGTNLCNDYSDFKKGADTEDRQGPTRVTQAGLLAPGVVKQAYLLFFAMAFFCSLYLLNRGGWVVILIAFLSVISGILYTAGPRPLGYMGLGDVFVLIFFGPVAVVGTYYVQVLSVNPLVFIAGLAPGLLSVAILVVNNLRDAPGDMKAKKRTLVVRFGTTFGHIEYIACIVVASLVPPILYFMTGEHPGSMIATSIVLLAWPTIRRVMSATSGSVLNPALGHTARLLVVYSVLFSVGWMI